MGPMRRTLLGLTASWLALAVMSCMNVLALGDYSGAASDLCELLEDCYGQSAFPSCMQHVSAGLEGAAPDSRTAWLGKFTDPGCLKSCSAAKNCLDETPICDVAGGTCEQLEQCCGFTVGEGNCGKSGCCLPDGLGCDDSAQCCTFCSSITSTCGGELCIKEGEHCERSEDCCSENCDEMGQCSFKCREKNDDCSQPSDCCSTRCIEGKCSCLNDGDHCSDHAECCSLACEDGICGGENCQGMGKPCDGPGGCCDEFECGSEANLCCIGNTKDCNKPSDCCGLGCKESKCCAKNDQPCEDSTECCNGRCNSKKICGCIVASQECAAPTDCCDGSACYNGTCTLCAGKKGCHDICKTGDPMGSSEVVIGLLCNDIAAPDSACVTDICTDLPYCCCTKWDDACVKLAESKSKDSNSKCFGKCGVTGTEG